MARETAGAALRREKKEFLDQLRLLLLFGTQGDVARYAEEEFDKLAKDYLGLLAGDEAYRIAARQYIVCSEQQLQPLVDFHTTAKTVQLLEDYTGSTAQRSDKEDETKEEILTAFAEKLSQYEYGDFSRNTPSLVALFEEAKQKGIVIGYGMSDDLFELDGAIRDEAGCWVGPGKKSITISFDKDGTSDDGKEHRNKVEIFWGEDPDGYCWSYSLDIPHAEFCFDDDGEPYCKGIIFHMEDML